MNEYLIGKNLGDSVNVEALIGLTLRRCVRDGNEIHLYANNGLTFSLGNPRDAEIEDICGELVDLVGSPITMAEEESWDDDPSDDYSRLAWYYYKFATVKGYVTIRFECTDGYYASYAQLTFVSDEFNIYAVDDHDISYSKDTPQIIKHKQKAHGGRSEKSCRDYLRNQARMSLSKAEKEAEELEHRIKAAQSHLQELISTTLPTLERQLAEVESIPVVEES